MSRERSQRAAAVLAAVALAIAVTDPGFAHDAAKHGQGGGGPKTAAPEPFPLDIRGRFALVDHTGAPRTDADFAGRYLLVYFGYSKCPYTCGVALLNISGALDELGAAGERLSPLFITVDPEYDTPGRLAAYLANFHARLIGLTGAPAEVRRVLADFRIEARARPDPGAYERLVDHTPFTYLFGPDGALLTILPPIVPPPQMAAIIRSYIE